MITNILIDIDNTLLDFDKCSEWCVEQSKKELGIELPQNVMSVFKEVTNDLWGRLEKKELRIEDIIELRWKMIFERLSVNAEGSSFETAFRKYLYESRIEEPGAQEALEYLSKKYRIYAASNGPTGQQKNRMKVSGMEQYLAGMFISEEVGASKPSKEFFDFCFAHMDIESPAEVLMIGDSMSADIGGAIAAGMQTCWYHKNRAAAETFQPTYSISDWREIREIL